MRFAILIISILCLVLLTGCAMAGAGYGKATGMMNTNAPASNCVQENANECAYAYEHALLSDFNKDGLFNEDDLKDCLTYGQKMCSLKN